MKKRLFIMSLMILFLPGCFYLVRYDSNYKGRVVDADTNQSIEGAVVLGVWYREYPTVAGAVTEFYDARETVSDKDGNFTVPGVGLRVFSNIVPMQVLIFKAGYEGVGKMPWQSLKEDFGLHGEKIKWEADRAIIPVKRLTMEERKKRLIGKELIPDKKQKLLIKELNKEKKELDKPLYPEVGNEQ